VATVLLILPLGCGHGSAFERLPVGGTVSLAGGEKLNGTITFLPVDGTQGPAAIASLVNGEYQFNRNDGPAAGPQRVIVNKAISKKLMLESRGKAAPPEQAAGGPPKTEWQKSVDLKAEGPYRCDFQLD
jgi:hypothetical protein